MVEEPAPLGDGEIDDDPHVDAVASGALRVELAQPLALPESVASDDRDAESVASADCVGESENDPQALAEAPIEGDKLSVIFELAEGLPLAAFVVDDDAHTTAERDA